MRRSLPTTRRLGIAATATALIAGASACTTGANSGGGAPAAGAPAVLRTALTSDAKTFDPAKAEAATDYLVARLMYDPLVRRGDGGKIVPGLAESWSVTPTSAEFQLRKDIKCSDGTPLTATAAAQWLTYYAASETKAVSARLVFGSGKVSATGDDATGKVKVELDHPWADLLNGLSLPQAGIGCAAGLKDPAALAEGRAPGTGAYTLKSSQRGTSYVFERRADYTWAPGFTDLPQGRVLDRIEMSVVQNESTLANMLTTKALDYGFFSGPDADRFSGGGWNARSLPAANQFIVFNERPGKPGADPEFRKAVAAVVDKGAYNNATTRGKGPELFSFSDANSPCVLTANALPAMDPAAVKQALSGKKVKMVATNATAGGAGAAYIQAVLKDAGADVELRGVDNATWATETVAGKGDWDVTIMINVNLTGTLTTPASLLFGDTPPAGRNFAAVDNPDFANAFKAATATVDPAQQCALWDTAQKGLLSRADMVPLSALPLTHTTASHIQPYYPAGLPDMAQFRVKG